MTQITTSLQAVELIKPYFEELEHEECWILVTSNLKPIIPIKVDTGNQSSVQFNIKKIATHILLNNGNGAIVFHNHPSEDPTPSSADIKETESLRNALSTLDISLIDHIIFTSNKFFSFADEKVTQIC